ncbi:MarR family winged helix-turn-helix transcriptional regulator [Asticcacaulis excentricus]|uniref:Transcriptional regulator, MarR family n=1 Tax=Asticcacaulis excentricus (strain ATCC 15261 / DSM 4724 / KCTC 12464 / NCIMB 9791 / VKM B-1370 / CB 48) TaxID=573065 RepID=E8RQQ1_ASTEC|nr:MarR family transcriptional regulator [Asticcacaulis excentricus]ADU13279.1 transcriptional regulator, MarR family [Asticcacaulis excentricus CB 48]
MTISHLEDHLGYWLRLVSNAVSHSFARQVEALGVTVAEWVFLRTLYNYDHRSPSLLAGQMGMTRGAITKLADRLIAKSLVTRTADPEDGRAQTLALTPEGRAKVPVLAKLADANDAAFFDALSAQERAALEQSLKSLITRRHLSGIPTN